MGKATLKGLLAHKLRLLLTALSVVLGVAFVSGTLVLTDTINHTFDATFTEVFAGVDLTVRARSGFGEGGGVTQDRATVPASLVGAVRAVPGVQEVEGSVGGYAQLVDPEGEAVGTGGAPNLGFNWGQVSQLSPLRIRDGRPPQRDGELVIDVSTAEEHGFELGQRVKVITRTGTGEHTLVGTAGFGTADNLAGASLAIFDTPTAQRLFGKEEAFDSVDIVAADGVPVVELRSRLDQALPDDVEVLAGDQVAKESSDSIKQGLSFFGTFLLTFAGISLFVGAFIIFNTFSILVAQRTRELGLLRALGASQRQVMTSVLVEALVVGLVSSVVGLGLGVLMAIGLQGLLSAFGIDLPTTTTQFLPRTVVASFIIGVGVTLVAAVAPARRASGVSPMAALREGGASPTGSLRRRGIVGGVVAIAGVSSLLYGLLGDSDNALSLVGLGAGLTFLGVAILSPLVARPLAGAIGAPLARLTGVSGKLGRQNAMRNPRRTAATAAALMIGLGLVGCVAVLASSIKESTNEVFDRSLAADFAVSTDSFMPSISPELAHQLEAVPELAAVSALRTGEWRLNGSTKSLYGASPSGLRQVLNVEMRSGDFDSLAGGELLVWENEAEEKGWKVGDTVPMQFARTGEKALRIGGTYEKNELLGSYLVSTATYEANYTENLDFVVMAKIAPGVSPAAARTAIERVAEAYPNVNVRDQTEIKDEQRKQVNQLVSLVSALLSLAILIAFFGIVNTLALSVFERTRELGLLRAVGMSRRQVRSMVRGESVITSVLGAILGLTVGVLFGWALVATLSSEGISELVFPGGQLAIYVVVAAIAGVLAAVGPARRAARLDVLEAISQD
ncbi:MAG: ABC transporter permease [Acidimicrobiales bacterium]